MIRSLAHLALALAILALAAACGPKTPEPATPSAAPSAAASPTDSSSPGEIAASPPGSHAPRARRAARPSGPSDAGGTIKVTYEVPKDPSHQEVYRILKGNRLFDNLCRAISRRFKLPEDLEVVFTECGEENAYYDPETRTISMCYELIDKYRIAYTDEQSTPEEVERETVNAALFTFYHELGHALVDILEIPATGREEDVVDEFAAIMLLQAGDEEGMDAVLSGIDQFAMDADESSEDYREIDELPFWDVHSLDQQRFYDLLCLLYGSDPEYFSDLVKGGDLPEDRADGCEEEFQRKAATWDKLLEPHLRGQDSSRMRRAAP